MKKILTVAGIALANVGAAAVLVIGFIVIDLFASRRKRQGVVTGAKVTADDRERFLGQLAEDEWRVEHVGVTVIGR